MKQQTDALTAIERLSDLLEGWDSYGAPRVEEMARKVAKDCLYQVQNILGAHYANPVVGPTPDGGVALAWRKDRGAEVDLLCTAQGARFLVLSPQRHIVSQGGPFMDCGHFAVQVLKRLDL